MVDAYPVINPLSASLPPSGCHAAIYRCALASCRIIESSAFFQALFLKGGVWQIGQRRSQFICL
jgi:hypothetical protein